MAALPALGAALRRTESRCDGISGDLGAQAWDWAYWLVTVRGYRAKTTVAAYVRALGTFAAWVATDGANWQAMTPKDWDRWQRRLFLDRGAGANYRRQLVSALKSFYGYRARMGLGRDCTDALQHPRPTKRTPRKYSPAQLRAMLAKCDEADTTTLAERNRALLLFLWATGGRREEVATLEIQQLEIENNRAAVRFFGKGAKERVVWFEGPALEHLVQWLDLRRDLPMLPGHESRLWTTCNPTAPNRGLTVGSLERTVEFVARAAKISGWGCHRFRVTCATGLYDAGVDIERIRIFLGHEEIETTRRYLALSDRQQTARLRSVDQHAALGTAPKGLPRWATQRQDGVPVPLTPFGK